MTDHDERFYIALGDSMSIDLYPRLDLEMLGRTPPDRPDAVGAASLFHRNADGLWPGFRGRDLVSRYPGIRKIDRTADGATIGDTLDHQLPGLPPEAGRAATVCTLTAGGNDLLSGLFDASGSIEAMTDRAIRRYRELVDRLRDALPAAVLILTTVYDPTDGTGTLPGLSQELGRLPMEQLDRFNDAVRGLAPGSDRVRLADAHRRFMGHGLNAADDDFWYWVPNPIEPGARGASEIRRLWLEALDQRFP